MERKGICPQCREEMEYSESNPFRPFCSERCKMIDLGAWASEDYAVEVSDFENEDWDEFDEEDL